MQVSIIASSSSGNVTYIETAHHKVLVDAGLSGKKIAEGLAKVGKDIKQVDSIFVTHEHSDHIKGLGVLMRRYDVNVYANEGTWKAMNGKIGKIPPEQVNIMPRDTVLSLDDLDVTSFGVSHDAAEPQFYQFYNQGKRFVILTDTGYVSKKIEATIKGADGYLMEFNHDTMMLRNGPYSWPLKQRIISDTGHLSNDNGAHAILDVIDRHTKDVYLGHLSHENNTKQLAREAAIQTLNAGDSSADNDLKILDTDPAEPQPLIVL